MKRNVAMCLVMTLLISAKASQPKYCKMAPAAGECYDIQVKFYYHAFKKTCSTFLYGGCGGNNNRFDTEQECQKRCEDTLSESGSKDICSLLPETGLCKFERPKFFYNAFTRKCEKFMYSNCGGNENNFSTRRECRKRCKDTPLPSGVKNVCTVYPETGKCRGRFRKFYYNATMQTCEEFTYSGCDGSSNRFDTQQECENRCNGMSILSESSNICLLPLNHGTCGWYVPQYFYNATSQKCQKFIYQGCDGNENRFNTFDECKDKCQNVSHVELRPKCYLPPKVGSCRYRYVRYYYHAPTGTCEQFAYSGCEGNDNRFHTQQECEEQCKVTPPSPKSDSICNLPAESGSCNDHIHAVYYNSSKETCEDFIYSGCGGNGNRFETQQECEEQCKVTPPPPKSDSICNLPAESGPCNDHIHAFHYNFSTRTCEDFIYGGCEGNDNRFETQQECQEQCKDISTT